MSTPWLSRELWLPTTVNALYEVSSRGRVRGPLGLKKLSIRRTSRRQKKVEIPYRVVRLGRTVYRVHTLVLNAFRGPPPEGWVSRHFPDGDPENNDLLNLHWGSHRVNLDDRVAHGSLKMTPESVAELRHERALLGMSFVELGRAHGISASYARDIVRYRVCKSDVWLFPDQSRGTVV